MSLDLSAPFTPGDRIRHIATGILGGVVRVTMGATADSWAVTVMLDSEPNRERTFAAWCLAPAPRLSPFTVITNPLRAAGFPPAAQTPGRSDPPCRPGEPFPPDCA
jgi:hypothetical protein